MGISLTEPGLIPFARHQARGRDGARARRRDATHTACIWGHAERPRPVRALRPARPRHRPRPLQRAAPSATGRCCSARTARSRSTPETEMQMGMGHPPIRRALDAGLVLSLSCDVVSSNSGDMFSADAPRPAGSRARATTTAVHARRTDPTELTFTTRDALAWATVNGAKALGMDDRHRLADARQAGRRDRRRARQRAPEHARRSPTRSAPVVQQANASNVQTVLVAGRPVKRDGRLLDVDLGRVAAMLERVARGRARAHARRRARAARRQAELRRPRRRAAAEPEPARAGA